MIGKYLRIYRAFFEIGVKRMLAYRFDTWVGAIVATGVWSFLTIFSMYALTQRTQGVFGWTVNELILLGSLYNVFIGTVSFFFARNFEEFSELVNTGKLDEMFVKPVDSQYMVSLRRVHVTALLRTFVGVIITVILIYKLQIPVTLITIVGFLVANVLGILLMYSILFIINTLNIWFTRLDNINQLFYTLRTLGRYPRGAFMQAGELVFVLASPFVIPLATPARVLVGKASAYDMWELTISTAIFFVICRMFWKFALHSYTSASG